MKKLQKGKPLTEMVKGSYDYARRMVARAFYRQFPDTDEEWYWVAEVFADYVIIEESHLPPDEFYLVSYTWEGDVITFAAREDWEMVELAYVPKSDQVMIEAKESGWVPEQYQQSELPEAQPVDLTESFRGTVTLTETRKGKTRIIKAIGQTVDQVNANNRRYPRAVAEAAIAEAQTNMANGGVAGNLLLGEAEHPGDKQTDYANFLETIVKWESISLNYPHVELEGRLILTSKGEDAETLMEAGVIPGISLRGYGLSKFIEEDGRQIEEVSELHYSGFDLVLEPADLNGAVTLFESKKQSPRQKREVTEKMDEMTLEALREKYPKLVAQIEAERDEARRKELELALQERADADERAAKAVQEREAKLREELGIGPDEDLVKALTERQTRLAELEEGDQADKAELERLREAERQQKLNKYIDTKAEELKYPAEMKTGFVDAVKVARPVDEAAVDALWEAKVKEYDAIVSNYKLNQMGLNGNSVEVIGPVFESETELPDYVRPAWEFTERMVERSLAYRRNFKAAVTPNEIFTRRYLAAFDRAYRSQLIEERNRLRAWQEAETTSDLNLPYSVSRAIVEEAFPMLVALSVFDFGFVENSPTKIFFEDYSAESGAQPAVTDEAFTSDHDAWVTLANKSLQPGTVSVTNAGKTVTYTEFDDYVIDPGEGRIMVLSSGTMADATGHLINYTYDKVRGRENQGIQRGKGGLNYQTIELSPDRLASLVTDEAITFARTQLDWDAVTRTMNMVIRELREMVDKRAIYLALASAHRAANNGGTWDSANDPIEEFVKKLGVAKVAIKNDYYTPQFFLLSSTNADRLSNWEGLKRDGFPDAVMNAAGFVGRVKGLPTFESTEMPDSKALCGHRELVQHRVLSSKPMSLNGPYEGRASDGSLIAGKEYYAEEYNTTVSLIVNKGGYVTVS